ncbi:uncharacterized protein LOC9660065 [Selaginella moellendorffii]|uniref:uncharacterized protein LOC9660065 n=1 Tax=Selaginella moellendorffii TaxID=88036 RepID=UPI000D1C4AD2|nr:uncharacterized protein LOC9660065 [Selaginella moellendorffii]|eukprot:XP_024529985.1 uncharacterized protein LOC9660065 [Selaginella moellendorffii]
MSGPDQYLRWDGIDINQRWRFRRILAMSEDDMPYAMSITPGGDLITMGRYSFNKRLFLLMCTHPKIDPMSGELFAVSFNPVINPHLRYFWEEEPRFRRVAAGSVLVSRLHDNRELRNPSRESAHPGCLNQKLQLFYTQHCSKGSTGKSNNEHSPATHTYILGPTHRVDRTEVGVLEQLRVLPANTPKSDNEHIPARLGPGPEEHQLQRRLQAGRLQSRRSECGQGGSSIRPVEHLFDDITGLSSRLHEIHLDLRSGRSWKKHVCSAGLDFGQMNQKFLGRKNRYVYMCYYGHGSKSQAWPRSIWTLHRCPGGNRWNK